MNPWIRIDHDFSSCYEVFLYLQLSSATWTQNAPSNNPFTCIPWWAWHQPLNSPYVTYQNNMHNVCITGHGFQTYMIEHSRTSYNHLLKTLFPSLYKSSFLFSLLSSQYHFYSAPISSVRHKDWLRTQRSWVRAGSASWTQILSRAAFYFCKETAEIF